MNKGEQMSKLENTEILLRIANAEIKFLKKDLVLAREVIKGNFHDGLAHGIIRIVDTSREFLNYLDKKEGSDE